MYWDDEQQERARGDFRIFLFMVWREIGLPSPTPIQYDIAHTLQNCPSDRFILEGFRGVAKSFITCAFSAWSLWNDPQKKVLIVSASKDRADANAIFIKRIFQTIPFLQYLLPTNTQRNTQNIFDLSKATPDISPSVKSVGITGQIAGSRADLLIADDVEVPNNSGTQMQRDKLNESVKEFDAIIKPGGLIIFLGTPQNEMSVYNNLQERGYTCRIYPVIFPETDAKRQYYGDRLAPFLSDKYDKNPTAYAGYPTDPARFDEEEIEKRKLSYGKAGFALQFELNTNLSDSEKYPLKVSDLIIESLDIDETSLVWAWSNNRADRIVDAPCVALKGDYYYGPLNRSKETQKYSGCIITVDPSGRGKDETAYTVMKYLNGYLFLMDCGGFTEGYDEVVLKKLAMKAKFFKCNTMLIEPNFGNGMFAQLMIPVMNRIYPDCAVEDAKTARGQKEARIIDTLEPVLMRHKLIVDRRVIDDDYKAYEKEPQYSLFYQLTRLSRDRGSLGHDDRLDSLEMAVSYWLDSMALDAREGLEELSEEQLEKWLDPNYGILYKEEKPPELTNTGYRKRYKNTYGQQLNALNSYMFHKEE